MKKNIAIIGMGISGLKVAYDLVKKSPHLISSLNFYEKNAELGGVLTNTKENHFLFEHGAQGVLLSRESFIDCINELNLQDKLIVPEKKVGTRYLIQNEKCVQISPVTLLKENLINFSSILSFVFKKKTPYFPNETLYEYFSRVFGKKIADNFLIPFCFGIWGGGAEKLLCRFCLSQFPFINTQNKKKSKKISLALGSFIDGMHTLPHQLFEKIKLLCEQNQIQLKTIFNYEVNSIHFNINNLILNNNNLFDIVIYACQPWLNEKLFFGDSLQHVEAMNIIKKTPTHDIAVVGIGGEKKVHFNYKAGFGALANKESIDLLGILFIHSIYKEHAPQNSFLYRILLGGDRGINVCNDDSDDELLTRSKNHLCNLQLLQGDEKINFHKVIRYKKYIPLATEYQDKVLCAIWQLEALNPGLFFTGNYINGVSVADCLVQAETTANKVTNYILEQS